MGWWYYGNYRFDRSVYYHSTAGAFAAGAAAGVCYAAFLGVWALFVLLYLLGQMKDIFSGLEDILSGLSGQSELTAIILKALGVCIVAELGSQCCRDAGETAIAAKVELAAKAALVMMSMPVFASLLEMAGELLRL